MKEIKKDKNNKEINKEINNKEINKEKQEKNKKKIKLAIFALGILIITVITCIIAPYILKISTDEGRQVFKQKIDSAGIFGPAIICFIYILQMILAVIPGEPIEIISGMCFGTVVGTLVDLVAIFIGTGVIFFTVKKIGESVLEIFFTDKQIEKAKAHKIFKKERTMQEIIFLIFFIPGVPKDIFIFLAPAIPIKPLTFIAISTFARLPSIISSTYAGANLMQGNFKVSIAVFALTGIISACIFLVFKYTEKNVKSK
ncbi:MAG: VTT domain-containing protein [Clostridia bacterium]